MIIYTDGSCRGNGKVHSEGGFGIVVYENGQVIDAYAHQEKDTTNNIQELKAILWAMIHYGSRYPTVYSDSAYAVNTLTSWSFTWKRNGWIKSDKKVPENLELIKAYHDLLDMGFKIDLRKVAGHAGDEGNELADDLACGRIKPEELIKDVNE